MKNTPLVSVLIPCYNSLKTIESTVKSALAQTYSNIEIIINDDCSVDGTFDYLKENYGNLKIEKNEKNLGMCANWNELFSKAKGEYWLKLDADDIIAPNFISTTLKYAISTNADFIGASYQFLDVQKNQTSKVFTHGNRKTGFIESPLQDIFINYPFHLCFTLLKASFVKSISPKYYFMETEVGDAEFQIRAALSPHFKAYFVAEEMGFYCFHGANSSLTPLKQAKSFIYDIVDTHHHLLAHRLGNRYRKKLFGNFKNYLKDMLMKRAPWDFKLLYYCLKHTIK